MKNKLIIASILGAWVMTIGMTTYAYQWNPGIMNPNCTDTERQAAVQEMFKNEIMSLSKTLCREMSYEKNRLCRKVQKFVELRQAKLAGESTKAEKLTTELQLWQKKMDGTWKMNGGKWLNAKQNAWTWQGGKQRTSK